MTSINWVMMGKKWPAVFALLPLMLVAFSSPSPADESQQGPDLGQPINVSVSVLTSNCAKFTGALVLGLDANGQKSRDRKVRPTQVADGLVQFTFSSPPGHHWLEVSTSDATPAPGSTVDDIGEYMRCSTEQLFTAIPNHDRHLVVTLGVNISRHLNCALVGTLPVKGLSIQLTIPKGTQMPIPTIGGCCGPAPEDITFKANVDGDAYYIEHIWAWKYNLEVGAGMSSGSIPIDLSKDWNVNNPYCQGVFTRNITPADLKNLFPTDWVTE